MSNVKILFFLISLTLGIFQGNGGDLVSKLLMGRAPGEVSASSGTTRIEQFYDMGEHIFLGILLSAIIIYTAMYFMGRKRKEYLFFALMNEGLLLWLLMNSPSFLGLFPALSVYPLNMKLSLSGVNMALAGFSLFYSWYRGRPRSPRSIRTLAFILTANTLFPALSPIPLLAVQRALIPGEAFVCFSLVLMEVIHKMRIRAIHPLGFFPGLVFILLAQYAPLFFSTSAACGLFLRFAFMILIMQQLIYHTYLTLNSFNRIRDMNREYAKLNLELKDSLERIEDQSELIHYMRSRDKTTGLASRTQFPPVLEREMSRLVSPDSSLCLAMAEWEDYKRMLHRRGLEHQRTVLLELADRMKRFCRDKDWVCRYSDDRFLLILPLKGESPQERTDELFRLLKKPFNIRGNGSGEEEEYTPRISMSFTLCSEGTQPQETLLRQLFASLDHAKRKGLCCPCGFERNIDMFLTEKVRLEAKLRQALKREQLNIYYQPQHESWQYAMTGMEALIRWTDPELGIMGPDDFLPLAEEIGLMEELDLYVLKSVLNQLVRWKKTELRDIPVSLNISPSNFANPSFIEDLIALTENRNIDPSRLEVELTETILVYNHGQILKNIHRLKEAGFSIALDDFGTGYSSLAYLSDFPVDVLKIDKAFVNNLLTDRRKKGIVNSIIAIGRALGMRVISEGVETEEELHYLRKAGSHTIQGYFFSPALPASQMLDYVRKTRSA